MANTLMKKEIAKLKTELEELTELLRATAWDADVYRIIKQTIEEIRLRIKQGE